jgi:hypothetical protein
MKNSSIPLIIIASFFISTIEILTMIHYFLGVATIPLMLAVPFVGSAVSWITMIMLSVLGIGLSVVLIYANEEEVAF